MPPLQLAGSELNSTFRLSIQWGPGPYTIGVKRNGSLEGCWMVETKFWFL
jgi:hypothetical protein